MVGAVWLAITRAKKGVSNVFFLFLCAGNRFEHEDPIVSNKYKNGGKN